MAKPRMQCVFKYYVYKSVGYFGNRLLKGDVFFIIQRANKMAFCIL